MDEDGEDSERAGLQREKEQLVVEINAALRDVVSNMRTLNRNMDSLIDVGQEIENVAEVRQSALAGNRVRAAARVGGALGPPRRLKSCTSGRAACRVHNVAHLTTISPPRRDAGMV